MKHTYRISNLAILLLLAGLYMSCSRASNPDIERGASYYFQAGHPEVRMSALGYLNEEDQGVISVTADIVNGSLIFSEEDGINQAEAAIEIRVIGTEGTTFTDNYRTTLQFENEQASYVTSQDIMKFEHEMNVPPGNYEVVLSIVDQSSGRQTTRSTRTLIPDPSDNIVNLTSVQLLAREDEIASGRYLPVTTYDVSASKDSIRFLIQITNNRSEDPMIINSRLLFFESDTTAARPMSHNNYSPSSMPYRGIEYSSPEEIDATRRVLEQPGSVMVEYNYALPSRGNYRFEVNASREGEENLYKGRDFGIKSVNYPAIKSPVELAEPLIYLMDDNEYERLMSHTNPDSLKEAIDRFWLANIQSTSRARNVITLYYERVEEANKQFSNFKEGWKTDPGMIYVLFGPPLYVEQRLNYMTWSYSYNRSDPRYNLLFQRPKMQNEFFPFNNYLFQRDNTYFNIQYQQIQMWRSGEILFTNM